MLRAIVDPEELSRFTQNLVQFNEQLRQSISTLNGQFKQLGITWQDQEHKKLTQEYEQTIKVIQRFINTTGHHIKFW